MARGSTTGFAVTSTDWATIFDTANGDGPPCTTFEGNNIDGSSPDILFMRVTDKHGIQSIVSIAIGNSRDVRCSVNGITKVEMKLKSSTGTAYGSPVAWGAENA